MDLFETINTRRSIRQFTARPVEEALLRRILEAAQRAPSAGNLQAYRVVIVRDPAIKSRLDAATGSQRSVGQAPVVLVFCADPARSATRYGSRGEELYCVQDATIACAYAQLAATGLGLGAVWIGAVFEPETVREALGLDGILWPVALLPIGWPAEAPAPRPRRPLGELVQGLDGAAAGGIC